MSQEKDPSGIGQHVYGAKLDAGKVDMSLLQLWPRALVEVCRVGTMGAEKYSRGGFLGVADGVVRYSAALLRHYFKEPFQKYDDDPYYDTKKGLKWKGTIRHDAQVAWNALSRLEIALIEEAKNNEQEQRSASSTDAPEQAAPVQQGELQPERRGIVPGPSSNRQTNAAHQGPGLGPDCYFYTGPHF